jgi:hypothetical protein
MAVAKKPATKSGAAKKAAARPAAAANHPTWIDMIKASYHNKLLHTLYTIVQRNLLDFVVALPVLAKDLKGVGRRACPLPRATSCSPVPPSLPITCRMRV